MVLGKNYKLLAGWSVLPGKENPMVDTPYDDVQPPKKEENATVTGPDNVTEQLQEDLPAMAHPAVSTNTTPVDPGNYINLNENMIMATTTVEEDSYKPNEISKDEETNNLDRLPSDNVPGKEESDADKNAKMKDNQEDNEIEDTDGGAKGTPDEKGADPKEEEEEGDIQEDESIAGMNDNEKATDETVSEEKAETEGLPDEEVSLTVDDGSNSNAAPGSDSKPKKFPKWLRKSLSVIGRAIRDADQKQHFDQTSDSDRVIDTVQEGARESAEVQQELADLHLHAEAKNDDQKDDYEETARNSLKNDSVNAMDVDALQEGVSEEVVEKVQEQEEDLDLEAKTKNLESFVQNKEKLVEMLPDIAADQNEEQRSDDQILSEVQENSTEELELDFQTTSETISFETKPKRVPEEPHMYTKASQALQDSTMKDRKVTEVLAAAVVIGASVFFAKGMSPETPHPSGMAQASS